MGSVKEVKRNKVSMKPFAGLIAVASIALAVFHGIEGNMTFALDNEIVFYIVAGLTVVISALLLVDTVRNRSYIAAAVMAVQLGGLACFDLLIGKNLTCAAAVTIDWLAVIVILLTGLMGGIICWRTGGNSFLILLILAVDGMALSDSLLWMYLFWMLVTLTSVHVIRKEGTGAKEYADKVLKINIYGGLCFVVGIVVSGIVFETADITTLNLIETVYSDLVAVPAIFIVLAGFARTMQMPFQGWFKQDFHISADTSALIQAVTLVNSGAVLIIRMAPAMGVSNFAGLMAIVVGGITFFVSSLNAITETNVRRVLADSTSSVMGLVVVCAGIGTSESIWAAIMLLIFNSVAKPLLLAGTESSRLKTDFVMATIVMMVSPFAIVLLQQNSMGSIGDTGNILLILIMCFSGAIAIFYWTRLLGSMISDALYEGIEPVRIKEMNPGKANAWLLVIIVVGMPFISLYMVVPYLEGLFGGMSSAASLTDNIIDTVVMAAAVFFASYPISRGIKSKLDKPDVNDEVVEHEDTHMILRRSPVTVKVQTICSVVSIGIIALCLCCIIINLVGLLGGALS